MMNLSLLIMLAELVVAVVLICATTVILICPAWISDFRHKILIFKGLLPVSLVVAVMSFIFLSVLVLGHNLQLPQLPKLPKPPPPQQPAETPPETLKFLDPAARTLAAVLKLDGMEFTEQDERRFGVYNTDIAFSFFDPQLFDEMRKRFEPHTDALFAAAENPDASWRLKHLVLRIAAKASNFDSPRAHRLLINILQNYFLKNNTQLNNMKQYELLKSPSQALAILAALPRKTLPQEIIPILERLAAKVSHDKIGAQESFLGLRALHHFDPENLPILVAIGESLVWRSSDDLFAEGLGFHKKVLHHNSTFQVPDVCKPFKGLGMRDSFTYEVARQLAVHSGNIMPILIKWMKSGDITLQHMAFESLRGRANLTVEALPAIAAFEKYRDDSVTSSFIPILLRLQIPSEEKSALSAMSDFLSAKSTEQCISSVPFLSFIAQVNPRHYPLICKQLSVAGIIQNVTPDLNRILISDLHC